ncbi:MAG: glycosyltransferase family 39 protein [Acidobacteriaceae bacterium]
MTPSVVSQPAEPRTAAVEESFLYRWLFPALGVFTLLGSCVLLSLKKQEWADEVFTRIEVSDPSLSHLMHALTRLGGAGMPLFYLTAWPWAHVFGVSDLSLRLYSSIGVCGAYLVLMAALRRCFSARSAFLGVTFGLFSSMIVPGQNAEARGYGLYLLLCALAIAQLLRVSDMERPRGRDLALLALSQAGVVLGHVLGLLFAGLMLLGLCIADLQQKRVRWKVWHCGAAGWLALLPWLPAIRASMAVGKPHGWILAPTIVDLLIGLSSWIFAGLYFPALHGTLFGVVIGWACAIFCVAGIVAAAFYALRSASPRQRAAYWIGLALVFAPVIFFAVSHLVTPIWVARYLLPSALGVGILAAGWADRFTRGTGALVLGIVALLLLPVTVLAAKPDFLDVARIDQLAAGRPIVCDWAPDFLVVLRYSAHPATVQFPLDWDSALAGLPAAVGAYHLMENYRRDGYLAGHVLDMPQVLSHPSFVVLDETGNNWFQHEIAANQQFSWQVLATIDATHRVIAVTRRR